LDQRRRTATPTTPGLWVFPKRNLVQGQECFGGFSAACWPQDTERNGTGSTSTRTCAALRSRAACRSHFAAAFTPAIRRRHRAAFPSRTDGGRQRCNTCAARASNRRRAIEPRPRPLPRPPKMPVNASGRRVEALRAPRGQAPTQKSRSLSSGFPARQEPKELDANSR